jgi:transposase
VIADALGNPVAISLTPGQASDLGQAEPLLEEVNPRALLADKAYDADALIDRLEARQITPVIPPKANRCTPRKTDFVLYCERNLIERFFNNLKQFRAIATRYDKLKSTSSAPSTSSQLS